jgi:hypothetical protein
VRFAPTNQILALCPFGSCYQQLLREHPHDHGVAILRILSFVVTLAGLLIWLGLHVLGDARTLNLFDTHVTTLASTFLP